MREEGLIVDLSTVCCADGVVGLLICEVCERETEGLDFALIAVGVIPVVDGFVAAAVVVVVIVAGGFELVGSFFAEFGNATATLDGWVSVWPKGGEEINGLV